MAITEGSDSMETATRIREMNGNQLRWLIGSKRVTAFYACVTVVPGKASELVKITKKQAIELAGMKGPELVNAWFSSGDLFIGGT